MEEFMLGRIQEILGSDAQSLLNHQCKTISKDKLHLPGPDFIDRIYVGSDRPIRALVSLQQLFKSGRLSGTGYVSILPVDRESSTLLVHRLLPIRFISILRTL